MIGIGDLLKYLILGVIQGITEPLPISSSGHLALISKLFNFTINDLNYEIITNFGSFIAIFIIFYKDIIKLIKGFLTYIFNKDKRKENETIFKYCWLIVVGSIPAAVIGILLKDKIETISNNTNILGICFLITSILLFSIRNKNGKKDDNDITFKDAIIIGLFESFALLPGISRSGTVMVACMLLGLKNKTALKYTFMLYLPVSLGSMVLGVKDLLEVSNLSSLVLPYALGMLLAFTFTYLCYGILKKTVNNGTYWKFSIYTLIIFIFTLIYFNLSFIK